MQKLFFIFLSLFVLSANSFAQDEEEVDEFVEDNYTKALIIKTATFKLLDMYNGSAITCALEYDKSSKYSMSAELGFMHDAFDFMYQYTSIKGLMFKHESRFFLFNSDNEMKYFLGAEFSWSYLEYSRIGSFGDDVGSYYMEYDAIRWYGGLALNFGGQYRYPKGLVIEYYLGFGGRLNSVESTLSNNDLNNRHERNWTAPHRWNQREGLNVIPKFNFGLRIGYNFKRLK